MPNPIHNVYRKNLSHDKYLAEISHQPDSQRMADDTFEQIMSADLYRAIIQQLDQLPEKCRESGDHEPRKRLFHPADRR